MWTIRQEQVDVFRQKALRNFEDEMVAHLQKFAPRHWKVMGETDGRRVIQLGIDEARKYDLTNRGPVRFYIELMFLFGSYFDTDPQHPWASTALSHPDDFDQSLRANRLYEAMKEYFTQVVEPERKTLRKGLAPLLSRSFDEVIIPGANLEQSILELFRSLSPSRYQYLGEPTLGRIIQNGFEVAKRYGFESTRGKALMVILTFAVGHGFYKDPLNGWIVRRMDRSRWPNRQKQVDELSSKSVIYLKHILSGGNLE